VGLLLTGKLVAVHREQSLSRALTRMIGKGGEPLIRKGVNSPSYDGRAVRAGQYHAAALANSRKLEDKGFRTL